jgi:hypothetical protein
MNDKVAEVLKTIPSEPPETCEEKAKRSSIINQVAQTEALNKESAQGILTALGTNMAGE